MRNIPEEGNILFGEPVGNFMPNINIAGANRPGTVSKAADEGIKYILQAKPGEASKVELVSKTTFSAGNSSGFKVVFKAIANDFTAKSIQYYFSGKKDAKIVITATLPWADSKELEDVVDEALRSYEVAK